jgi:transketolase
MQEEKIKKLENIAAQARRKMVETLIIAGCGHPGGAFSCIDFLVVLYFSFLRLNLQNPKWKDRDRFILSKGHSSVALYSVLHLKGFFDEKILFSFRQDNSLLSGHPDMHKVPGVDMSTGSLGHGLSVGVGCALAARMDERDYRTVVLMGDGETQEGSIWEAAMSASHYKLDNLIGIIDRNKIQIDGFTEDIISLEPYREKWESFGWAVREIDGHKMDEILTTLKELPFQKHRPSLIISNTIKGKGISFMENNPEWHGKALTGEFINMARLECRFIEEG